MSKRSKKEDDANLTAIDEPILPAQQEPEIVPDMVPEVVAVEEAKPVVPLAVFAASGKHKWDQLAGFVRYAQQKKLEPRTIPEWRKAHADFQNRPV